MCPEKCLCFSDLNQVVCKHVTAIPEGIPRGTEKLLFSMCNITRMEPAIFEGLPNLKSLILRDSGKSSFVLTIVPVDFPLICFLNLFYDTYFADEAETHDHDFVGE